MNFKPLIIAVMAVLAAPAAQAELSIFACEPEWASLAQQLGGDKVDVFTATTALQDPHHIEARPSLIAKIRSADLVICTGAELEVGWLPVLLRQASNRQIQAGQPGYFMAAEQVDRLDVHTRVSRDQGDVHASGNPHVHLDPHRLLAIADRLSQRFSQLDADQSEHYQQRANAFRDAWHASVVEWEQRAATLAGKKVIVHHANWRYLFAWLKIDAMADLEPKPGLPPSSGHLASLLASSEKIKPDMIVVARYQNSEGARWLGKRIDAPVVILPFTVGGNDQAHDLFSLYNDTLTRLLVAVSK